MSERFRVARGGLLPESAEEGLSGEGRYTRLPTSPDLLIFVRTPAQGGEGPAGRVMLAGDASAFPVADLLAFLAQSRWSGTLRVRSPGAERSIFLKEGEVRGASSEDPADRLGEVIVRLGYLTTETLEGVLADHPPSKVGRALVDRGVLQAHDLYRCMTHQASEIFHALVLAHEGSFELSELPSDDRASGNLRLSIQSLLMDSIRRIDELAHFRKKIPHGRLYVIRKRVSDGELEPDEEALLAKVDGDHTVRQLGQRTRLAEFDATKIVFRLLEGGYVTLSERPGRNADPAPAPASPQGADASEQGDRAAEVVRTFNKIFGEIFEELRRHGQVDALLQAANASLGGQVLKDVAFSPEGTLPETTVLERFHSAKDSLGPEPVTGLRRALSDVMYFLLFQTGDMLDPAADEALGVRVKSLLTTLER